MVYPMREWFVFGAAGVLTYLTRASFLLLGDRLVVPSGVRKMLRYVAPAAFAGIAVPAVVGSSVASVELSALVAGFVAVLVVWKTRNLVLCMVSGMATLWLAQWFGL